MPDTPDGIVSAGRSMGVPRPLLLEVETDLAEVPKDPDTQTGVAKGLEIMRNAWKRLLAAATINRPSSAQAEAPLSGEGQTMTFEETPSRSSSSSSVRSPALP